MIETIECEIHGEVEKMHCYTKCKEAKELKTFPCPHFKGLAKAERRCTNCTNCISHYTDHQNRVLCGFWGRYVYEQSDAKGCTAFQLK